MMNTDRMNVPHRRRLIYHWYEASEEPFWLSGSRPEVLSWWLRRNGSAGRNWFVDVYPVLAPYYPLPVLYSDMDPLMSYQGYWWP